MSKWLADEIDQSIEGTPFKWRDALQQGIGGPIYVPTDVQYENIVRQAHALQPVFYLLGGFKITSWLRSPDHNKLVGGAPSSMHLTGLATDIVPDHYSPDEARAKVKAAGAYPGRTEIDASTWIHYDLKNNTDFYGRPKK